MVEAEIFNDMQKCVSDIYSLRQYALIALQAMQVRGPGWSCQLLFVRDAWHSSEVHDATSRTRFKSQVQVWRHSKASSVLLFGPMTSLLSSAFGHPALTDGRNRVLLPLHLLHTDVLHSDHECLRERNPADGCAAGRRSPSPAGPARPRLYAGRLWTLGRFWRLGVFGELDGLEG